MKQYYLMAICLLMSNCNYASEAVVAEKVDGFTITVPAERIKEILVFNEQRSCIQNQSKKERAENRSAILRYIINDYIHQAVYEVRYGIRELGIVRPFAEVIFDVETGNGKIGTYRVVQNVKFVGGAIQYTNELCIEKKEEGDNWIDCPVVEFDEDYDPNKN